MKIKSGILLCLVPGILCASNPPSRVSIPPSSPIPQHFTSEHVFKVDSSNPGPFVIRLETVHTSPTLDRATNVFEKASNAYFHTPSLCATLGPVVIGLVSFYCGWKLSQIEKPQTYQKVLSGVLMTCGFLAACAPFVFFLVQSRTISV